VKVVRAGVLYENEDGSSCAINGYKFQGSVGGAVRPRVAIFVIGDWVRSRTSPAVCGDAVSRGDD
jgi:hypothetical protein